MKCLLCLLVWCSLISYISSQCAPEDDGNLVGSTYRIPNVPDTTRGDLSDLSVPGLTSIVITLSSEFLTASNPSIGVLTLSLTDEFQNYEAVTRNTASPLPIIIAVQLTCESSVSNSLSFMLTIDDVNNNYPTFDQSEYTYRLPTPFPANLEITQFGANIIAEDIDFTNMDITFEIVDSDLFVMYNEGTTDTLLKNHKASLVSLRPLQFAETQTFTIRATDAGNPTLSGTATLIIEIDEANSVPSPPIFDDPYHEVAYDNTGDIHYASVTMGITNAESSICELEGAHASFFECDIVGNEVNVNLIRNLEEDDIAIGGYRVLVVAARESETRVAKTVVILQIPDPITTTTACPTEPTETTTTCEVCEVCTTPTPEECICTTTEISTTECATESTVTITTCEPCECTTTEAVTCPNIEDILSTACPTTTTEVSSTITTCEPCECTTTEAVTCPSIEDILSTACPTTTTETTLVVTTCEPCESSTTETTTCPSIEDILSTACPSTTTGTPMDPDDNTPCPECPTSCPPIPDDCTTTEALDCSTVCSTIAPEDCPICPETTPSDCPETSTESLDCSTACSTSESVECPLECPETTPLDCPETSTEALDCSTACSTLAPVECPLECPETTPCDCQSVTTDDLDSSTACSTSAPVECPVSCPETTPCECSESSTVPLDCSSITPSTPVECPVSCPETTPCECSESSTVPLDCSTITPSTPDCPQEPTECPVCPNDCSDCIDECPTCPDDCSDCIDECPTCPDDCSDCIDECPACPNDCSDCTDEICATSPIPAVITFNANKLEFTLAAYETISRHSFPMAATSTIEETITYTADGLPSQLDLDSGLGMLSNNDFLPAGLYRFTITATGDLSGASASQEVTINVVPYEICADGARVTYSLLLKSTPENQQTILLEYPVPEDGIAYEFEITEVSPSAGADRFYVSEDGLSVGCYELDRESSDFDGMDVAQYTITVTVTEVTNEEATARSYRNNVPRISNETYVQALASSRADSEQYILISDILNNPTRTVITITVEDENDNAPVFETTSMIVGYPASTLLATIAPRYIVQVEATDRDSGINAQLAYSVPDTRVRVHSNSGIIYPTDGMPDTDFTFTVTARDQNGAGLESTNSLQVQVKILNQEHISILTLENVFLDDMDEKILELENRAGVSIKQLEASVLPSITSRQLRAGETYYLIVTVYALDSSNALVTTEQLQTALANVEGLSVRTLPEASSSNDDSDSDSGSNVGLIAAVSVLGAVLVLMLIGFLVFYYFRIRKSKPYDQMEEENTASAGPPTPPQYQKNIATTRSSSKLSHLGHDIEKMERRPTGILMTGAVGNADNESPPVSPPKERRKSVVFNANVEQINIDTSRDSDDGIESSKL